MASGQVENEGLKQLLQMQIKTEQHTNNNKPNKKLKLYVYVR